MDYKLKFEVIWQELQSHEMFTSMENTIEDSPWHRESNVLVHTQMVVAEFLKMWHDASDKNMYLAIIAAAFHDVGKPAAEEVKQNAERGTYRSYAGHEHVSAVVWLRFVLHSNNAERLNITSEDAYLIAWMIEFHLPYAVKDKVKRQGLYDTPRTFGATQSFLTLLRADTRGRQSDGHAEKLKAVEDWIEEYLKLEDTYDHSNYTIDSHKLAFVLIGCSSSGKSTLRKQIEQTFDDNVCVFSMDDIRTKTFRSIGNDLEQYQFAFSQSIGDGKALFQTNVNIRLNNVFDGDNRVIISDNCNLSKKARAQFTSRARQRGFQVIAIVAMTHPDVASEREALRSDRKGVPIYNQFNALAMPTIGSEVDRVITVFADENLTFLR